MNKSRSAIATFLLAGITLCVAACQPMTSEQQLPPAPPPAMPYADIVQRYNQRLAPVDQLWASTTLTARWKDDKDKWHFEQGDGPLIWRRPGELALAVGKLGNTRFWLGCNRTTGKWWLFDLGDKQRIAYVGDTSKPVSTGQSQVLPVPIRPDQLVRLLGLTPLNASASAMVESVDGGYLLTFAPEQELGRLHQRLWIDTQFRPVRLALLDEQDRTMLDVKFDHYQSFNMMNPPAAGSPQIAGSIDLTLGGGNTFITLTLNQCTDGKQSGKVKDVQFDFNKLVTALKIDQIRPIDPDPTNSHPAP